MKNFKYLAFLLLLLSERLPAQTTYFNKRLDITNEYWDNCTSLINSGNEYFILGNNGPTCHICLSNLDSQGNIKWVKNYDEISFIYVGSAGSLIQDKDKNFILCGEKLYGPEYYSTVIKVDTAGDLIYQKEYHFLCNGFFSGANTIDSGYIFTGEVKIGLKSYLLLKVKKNGDLEWYQYYNVNSTLNYRGTSVIETPDNGYCFGGFGINPNTGSFKGIVEIYKTNNLGIRTWKKTYGDSRYYNSGGMLCLSKDSCIIFTYGYTKNVSLGVEYLQLYITKIGLNGAVIWNKKIGNVLADNKISWIQTLDDGSYIMCGNHKIIDTINKSVGFLFKLTSNGDSIWYKEYTKLQGPNELNILSQVIPMPDKGFAGAGTLYPNESGGRQNVWVFKTDSMGCLIPHCDIGITEFNPNAGAQMLVYPNPFSNAFAINYNIPKENKKAVFQLYDIYGKLIYQIVLNNNMNQLQVVTNSLKAGIYFASIEIDGILIKSEKIVKSE